MAPPIVVATMQSALLAAASNLIAQKLTAYREGIPLVVDYIPVLQFVLYAILNTPPNFLWQDFLEQTFPATTPMPPKEEKASKEKKGADGKAKPVPGGLNMRNTVTKLVLDQTVGAAVNTFMFSVFIHSVQAAMVHRPAGAENSLMFLAQSFAGAVDKGRPALDFSVVNWDTVVNKAKAEFVPLLTAGWRLWPLVSLVNFACIETVEMRNLVGGLAGVGWGVYMSLFAAGS